MTTRIVITTSLPALVALAAAGCQVLPAASESEFAHRFTQPAEQAARCFARNAEAHSSALVAEVSGVARGRYEVVVRVKNGATYAIARIGGTGPAATGVVQLNVQSSRGNRELLDALVEGC